MEIEFRGSVLVVKPTSENLGLWSPSWNAMTVSLQDNSDCFAAPKHDHVLSRVPLSGINLEVLGQIANRQIAGPGIQEGGR